ncbi:hypothetical protein EJD97_003899 [Solanum chilense]|uniref:CCHC-type domain-containing protein n=1 Tax=Solanum chilense TaxID=4083 RepID=A0A6N2C044_SOLCI|nr:hypothetical protein EJD97_003899 [Solanum chilense]
MADNNVTVVVSTPTQTVVPQVEKSRKFSGVNFKGWQQWVFFWLTTIGLEKFTNEETTLSAHMSDREMFMIIKAWNIVELQLILHDLIAEAIVVNEACQVAVMIEKLPPSRNDFKNYIKHKGKKMNCEDLVIRLKIEEDNKTAKYKSRKSSTIIGDNNVEEDYTIGKKRNKSNGQKSEEAKKKFKDSCYNCGMVCHKYSDCRCPRKSKDKVKSQEIIIQEMYDAYYLFVMISECNLVKNTKD